MAALPYLNSYYAPDFTIIMTKLKFLLLTALFISSAVATAQSLTDGVKISSDSYYAKQRKHFTNPNTLVRHTAGEGEVFREVYITVTNENTEEVTIDFAGISLSEQALYLLLSERLKGEELATIQTIPAESAQHYRLLFKTPAEAGNMQLRLEGMEPLSMRTDYSNARSYLDADHYKIADSVGAFLYTTTTDDVDRTILRIYQAKDNVLLQEQLRDSEGKSNGITTDYYPDRVVKSEVYKIAGESVGYEISYHENGQVRELSEYEQGEEKIIQAWDEDGTPLLEEGNGTLSTNTAQGREKVRVIADHQLYASYEIREDGSRLFNLAPKPVEYEGGMMELYHFIGKTLRYPKKALGNGLQGRVMVMFEVSAEGIAENIQVIKGVAPSLDEEAVRIISMTDKWIPAEYEGEKVRTNMVLPISFRLN